jgi:hypothetical protein
LIDPLAHRNGQVVDAPEVVPLKTPVIPPPEKLRVDVDASTVMLPVSGKFSCDPSLCLILIVEVPLRAPPSSRLLNRHFGPPIPIERSLAEPPLNANEPDVPKLTFVLPLSSDPDAEFTVRMPPFALTLAFRICPVLVSVPVNEPETRGDSNEPLIPFWFWLTVATPTTS